MAKAAMDVGCPDRGLLPPHILRHDELCQKQTVHTCMFELVCLCLHIYATNTEQGVQLWVASASQLLGVPLNYLIRLTRQLPTGTYDQATWTLTCKYACVLLSAQNASKHALNCACDRRLVRSHTGCKLDWNDMKLCSAACTCTNRIATVQSMERCLHLPTETLCRLML